MGIRLERTQDSKEGKAYVYRTRREPSKVDESARQRQSLNRGQHVKLDMMFGVSGSKSGSLTLGCGVRSGTGWRRKAQRIHTYMEWGLIDRPSGLAGGSRRVCGSDMARPTTEPPQRNPQAFEVRPCKAIHLSHGILLSEQHGATPSRLTKVPDGCAARPSHAPVLLRSTVVQSRIVQWYVLLSQSHLSYHSTTLRTAVPPTPVASGSAAPRLLSLLSAFSSEARCLARCPT